ncbi:MAG: indolepyruvate ferredoxin oxidoreductase subunit alpha [Promethearchaeota archaeon]
MVDERFYAESGRALMIGNEAIVRGCLECGVGFVSQYPGTPTSDIGETFQRLLADDPQLAEVVTHYWAVNEAVSVSQAAGAAWAGARAMAPMKHVGVNVASDPLSVISLNGPNPGALVVVCGEDPGSLGSHQEQKTAPFYAWMFHMPILEPQTPQECKDFTKMAFELSQEHDVPVFLRTTTRSAHSRSFVELGPLQKPKGGGHFTRNIPKYCSLPPHAIANHAKQFERIEAIRKRVASLDVNVVLPGDAKTGVVTSGIPFGYVVEALHSLERDDVPVLKLGMPHPLDYDQVAGFMKDLDRVVVVEELESFLELKLAEVAHSRRLDVEIAGKQYFPATGEFSTGLVTTCLAKALDAKPRPVLELALRKHASYAAEVPKRFPTFCAGCPERATVYAIKQAYDLDRAVVAGDIGCYVMSFFPPLECSDFIICMSGGLSAAIGLATQTDQPILAMIGDSTFLHTGMAPLADAVAHEANLTLVVFVNNWVAMTGHQPVLGLTEGKLSIEQICRAIGASSVKVVDPFQTKQLVEELRRCQGTPGLKVLVVKRECMLQVARWRRREEAKLAKRGEKFRDVAYAITGCQMCNHCSHELSCPAIVRASEHGATVMEIDDVRCNKCGVCYQICPNGAVKRIEFNPHVEREVLFR